MAPRRSSSRPVTGARIVTDADLRAHVVGGDVARESPVSLIAGEAVASTPTGSRSTPSSTCSSRAPITSSSRTGAATVLGIVSATDLMGFETWSPFALRHAALRAHDEDEVVRVAGGLRRLFLALLAAGLPPIDIGRVLTLQLDSLRLRLIDFAIEGSGRRRPRGRGSCSAAPPAASSRSAPTRRTRSPTPTATAIRRRRLLRALRAARQRGARALRLPPGPQRRARAQRAVADVRSRRGSRFSATA